MEAGPLSFSGTPGMMSQICCNFAKGMRSLGRASLVRNEKMIERQYDVIVVGAGHAGCEAASAAARMGCVTGKGFASLIREQYGVRLSALAMLALLISNTTVTLSELAGIASALGLFGVPTYVSVPIAALIVWLIAMSGSYERIEDLHMMILHMVVCWFKENNGTL